MPGRARAVGLTVLAVAAAGALAAAAYLRRGSAVPEVDLAGAQAAVREAVSGAQAAVRARPESAEAWGELGMVFHAHDFMSPAAQAYERAAELAPSDPRWPYLSGLAIETADPEGALEHLARAEALGQGGLAFDWHRAKLLMSLGRRAEAKQAFLRGLGGVPNSAHLLSGLGQVSLQDGDLQGAQRYLERAVEADPHWAESYSNLAQVYARLGRSEDSERTASLARALEREEQTSPADEVFQEVVLRGRSSRWLVRRGRVAFGQGETRQAEALLREALAQDPGNAAAHNGLGVVLQGQRRLAEAIGEYREALSLAPDHVEARSNLGLALAESGKAEEASKVLEEALEEAPGHVDAGANLALVRLSQGRPQEALDLIAELLRQHPSDRRLLEANARALAAAGRPSEAAEAWAALGGEAAPSSARAVVEQAGAAMAAGRHDEAIRLLRGGLDRYPGDVLVLGTLAWELASAPQEALRDGAEALALARQAAAGMPGQPQGQDILAVALAETGDTAAAAAAAEAALASLSPEDPIAAQVRQRLELYRQGRPYRQPK